MALADAKAGVGGRAPSTSGALAHGAAYVVFGHSGAFAFSLSVSALNGTNGFTLVSEGSNALVGQAVAVGDIHGDGIDDFIVGGASGNSPRRSWQRGRAAAGQPQRLSARAAPASG